MSKFQATRGDRLFSYSTSILLSMLATTAASAQIIPDATLPNNTIVAPNGNTIRIDGGTRRGINLFHSFREFNLGLGSNAFFNNSADIANIISRVTGGKLSNIDGILSANGNANLFLINPAGIVFGPNARLNIGGSFIGSTANRIIFDNGSFYSAIAPDAPPLLTVNVPIGLQLSNPGEIRVTGNGNSGIFPRDGDGLAVSSGNTLALVGGEVKIGGGIVGASSGRVEIGSAIDGEVSLTPADVGWQLGYEGVGEFGDIRLSDRSLVWNRSSNNFPTSGIQVRGRRVVLEGRSQIASITEGTQPGGDILINTTEALEIGGGEIDSLAPFASRIVSQVEERARGSGGAVTIIAPQLRIFDGSRIQSLSFGNPDAGNIAVNVTESIAISGFAVGTGFENIEENLNSRIASENYSSGSGGNISVSTRQLTLLEGGQIGSFVTPTATGNGGHIGVNVSESIQAISVNPLDPTSISAITSESRGAGEGGNINISTTALTLREGAFIRSWSIGTGRGGDINVNASESISAIDVYPPSPNISSGIGANAFGPGAGGYVSISTGRLLVSEGADVGTAVLLQGFLEAEIAKAGTGNAGNLTVNADTIEVTGTTSLAPEDVSTLGSFTFASGNAGDVTISTRELTVSDGASISSGIITTFLSFGEPLPESGTGNGGNLTVNASEAIALIGVDPFLGFPSTLGTLNLGSGNAGNTIINTRQLIVRDGGSVNSFTGGTGNAGEIAIDAAEILVDGVESKTGTPAEVSASALIFNDNVQQAFFLPQTPTGNTGELTINTNRLRVRNGGRINVQHQGTGNAGTLQINATEILLESGGSITAASASGRGGNITLNIPNSLQLRGGSRITAEAGGIGNGGNLTVNAETITLLRNSNINANAFEGNGGNISIATSGLFLSAGSNITASSQLGVDGTVTIEEFGANPGEEIIDVSGDRLDPAILVVVGCQDYENSEFIITGRGGMSPDPTQPLTINAHLLEWALPNSPSAGDLQVKARPQTQPVENTSSLLLVEATGWIVNRDGKIILVADVTPATRGFTHPGCR